MCKVVNICKQGNVLYNQGAGLTLYMSPSEKGYSGKAGWTGNRRVDGDRQTDNIYTLVDRLICVCMCVCLCACVCVFVCVCLCVCSYKLGHTSSLLL